MKLATRVTTALAAVGLAAAGLAVAPTASADSGTGAYVPVSEGTFLDDGRYVASHDTGKVKVNLQTGCSWRDTAYVGAYVVATGHTNRAWTVEVEASHTGYKNLVAVNDQTIKSIGQADYLSLDSGKTVRPLGTVTVTLSKDDLAEPIVLEYQRPHVNCGSVGGATTKDL